MSNAYLTLITAQEVIYYTPGQTARDIKQIKPLVPLKEEGLFDTWLGADWYAALLADLVSYTTVLPYKEGTDYALDTVVIYRDFLYKAIAQTGGAVLDDETKWVEAPRFTDANNEYLWKRYLRSVIAWNIMKSGLVYTAMRQTEKGIVQAGSTESQRPVTGKWLAAYKAEVGEDAANFMKTMDSYLRKNSTLFPLYSGNVSATCKTGKSTSYPTDGYGFTF